MTLVDFFVILDDTVCLYSLRETKVVLFAEYPYRYNDLSNQHTVCWLLVAFQAIGFFSANVFCAHNDMSRVYSLT